MLKKNRERQKQRGGEIENAIVTTFLIVNENSKNNNNINNLQSFRNRKKNPSMRKMEINANKKKNNHIKRC